MIQIGIPFQGTVKTETSRIVYASVSENKVIVEVTAFMYGEHWTTKREFTITDLSNCFEKGIYSYLPPSV